MTEQRTCNWKIFTISEVANDLGHASNEYIFCKIYTKIHLGWMCKLTCAISECLELLYINDEKDL